MAWMNWVGLGMAIALFLYLGVALMKPEWF